MFTYTIGAGNPEGTDFSFDIDHEKEFIKEEFDNIAEEAFVYALEKKYKEKKHAFISSIDIDYMLEYLTQKGFVLSKSCTQSYYLEPYWGKEHVKSEKLLAWINRKKTKDAPDYFK
jgi:hypothetical protein